MEFLIDIFICSFFGYVVWGYVDWLSIRARVTDDA